MRKGIFNDLLRQEVVGIIVVVILIGVILSVNAPGVSSYFNQYPLLRTVSIMIIVGLSQLFVISVDQVNLALRSTGLLSGLSTAFLLKVTLINYCFGQRTHWLQFDRKSFMNCPSLI